jgi:hypothetical protein
MPANPVTTNRPGPSAPPPQPDEEFDYTATDGSPPPFGTDSEADDYVLPEVNAVDQTSEEITMSRSFQELPPGDYELIVVGFLGAPEREHKDVYLGGRKQSYQTFSVVVKLGWVEDPSCQVTDYMLLPPDSDAANNLYCNGSKGSDGKNPGFLASKFYQFIGAIGYVYPKGKPLPEEARRLGNWKGRRVHATVIPGDEYTDKNTSELKEGRPQVKLFSYRPTRATVEGRNGQRQLPMSEETAGSTATAPAPATQAAPPANRGSQPQRPANPPASQQTRTQPQDARPEDRGFDNI